MTFRKTRGAGLLAGSSLVLVTATPFTVVGRSAPSVLSAVDVPGAGGPVVDGVAVDGVAVDGLLGEELEQPLRKTASSTKAAATRIVSSISLDRTVDPGGGDPGTRPHPGFSTPESARRIDEQPARPNSSVGGSTDFTLSSQSDGFVVDCNIEFFGGGVAGSPGPMGSQIDRMGGYVQGSPGRQACNLMVIVAIERPDDARRRPYRLHFPVRGHFQFRGIFAAPMNPFRDEAGEV